MRPHHSWPRSHQTTKFLFLSALLKSDEDDSLRILIRLFCSFFLVIFTSNSVKSRYEIEQTSVFFKLRDQRLLWLLNVF